jgi:hypothetical protein
MQINKSQRYILSGIITNLADKAKTERKFIKEETARHTGVWRGFLTQRNFLYVED